MLVQVQSWTQQYENPHRYSVWVFIAHKLLCVRTAVSGGDMFFSPCLARKTVEPGEGVLMSVSELET